MLAAAATEAAAPGLGVQATETVITAGILRAATQSTITPILARTKVLSFTWLQRPCTEEDGPLLSIKQITRGHSRDAAAAAAAGHGTGHGARAAITNA
eukprot:1137446-Pelagomonas_calceolata.AAC.11